MRYLSFILSQKLFGCFNPLVALVSFSLVKCGLKSFDHVCWGGLCFQIIHILYSGYKSLDEHWGFASSSLCSCPFISITVYYFFLFSFSFLLSYLRIIFPTQDQQGSLLRFYSGIFSSVISFVCPPFYMTPWITAQGLLLQLSGCFSAHFKNKPCLSSTN